MNEWLALCVLSMSYLWDLRHRRMPHYYKYYCVAGGGEGTAAQQSPWLGLEASPKLEINSLICNKSLSVNSLDIEGGFLLCGTDSENIYTLSMPHLG